MPFVNFDEEQQTVESTDITSTETDKKKEKIINPFATQEESGYWDEVKKGMYEGFYNTLGSFAGATALAGEALGSQGVKEWGLEKYKSAEEKAKEYEGAVPSYSDIDSIDSAVKYALHGIGSAVPTMVPSMAGGFGGALLGRTALRKGAQELLEGQIQKEAAKKLESTALREGLEGLTEQEAKQVLTDRIKKEAADEVITKYAGGAGAFVPNWGMESGGIYGTQATAEGNEGKTNILGALGYGALAAALDTLSEMNLAKKFGLLGKTTSKVDDPIYKRIPKSALDQAWKEGATEVGQTILERKGTQTAFTDDFMAKNPQYDVFSKEGIDEMINAGLIGALSGGFFGGLGGIKKPAVDRSGGERTITDELMAGLPAETPPVDMAAGATAGATGADLAQGTTPPPNIITTETGQTVDMDKLAQQQKQSAAKILSNARKIERTAELAESMKSLKEKNAYIEKVSQNIINGNESDAANMILELSRSVNKNELSNIMDGIQTSTVVNGSPDGLKDKEINSALDRVYGRVKDANTPIVNKMNEWNKSDVATTFVDGKDILIKKVSAAEMHKALLNQSVGVYRAAIKNQEEPLAMSYPSPDGKTYVIDVSSNVKTPDVFKTAVEHEIGEHIKPNNFPSADKEYSRMFDKFKTFDDFVRTYPTLTTDTNDLARMKSLSDLFSTGKVAATPAQAVPDDVAEAKRKYVLPYTREVSTGGLPDSFYNVAAKNTQGAIPVYERFNKYITGKYGDTSQGIESLTKDAFSFLEEIKKDYGPLSVDDSKKVASSLMQYIIDRDSGQQQTQPSVKATAKKTATPAAVQDAGATSAVNVSAPSTSVGTGRLGILDRTILDLIKARKRTPEQEVLVRANYERLVGQPYPETQAQPIPVQRTARVNVPSASVPQGQPNVPPATAGAKPVTPAASSASQGVQPTEDSKKNVVVFNKVKPHPMLSSINNASVDSPSFEYKGQTYTVTERQQGKAEIQDSDGEVFIVTPLGVKPRGNIEGFKPAGDFMPFRAWDEMHDAMQANPTAIKPEQKKKADIDDIVDAGAETLTKEYFAKQYPHTEGEIKKAISYLKGKHGFDDANAKNFVESWAREYVKNIVKLSNNKGSNDDLSAVQNAVSDYSNSRRLLDNTQKFTSPEMQAAAEVSAQYNHLAFYKDEAEMNKYNGMLRDFAAHVENKVKKLKGNEKNPNLILRFFTKSNDNDFKSDKFMNALLYALYSTDGVFDNTKAYLMEKPVDGKDGNELRSLRKTEALDGMLALKSGNNWDKVVEKLSNAGKQPIKITGVTPLVQRTPKDNNAPDVPKTETAGEGDTPTPEVPPAEAAAPPVEPEASTEADTATGTEPETPSEPQGDNIIKTNDKDKAEFARIRKGLYSDANARDALVESMSRFINILLDNPQAVSKTKIEGNNYMFYLDTGITDKLKRAILSIVTRSGIDFTASGLDGSITQIDTNKPVIVLTPVNENLFSDKVKRLIGNIEVMVGKEEVPSIEDLNKLVKMLQERAASIIQETSTTELAGENKPEGVAELEKELAAVRGELGKLVELIAQYAQEDIDNRYSFTEKEAIERGEEVAKESIGYINAALKAAGLNNSVAEDKTTIEKSDHVDYFRRIVLDVGRAFHLEHPAVQAKIDKIAESLNNTINEKEQGRIVVDIANIEDYAAVVFNILRPHDPLWIEKEEARGTTTGVDPVLDRKKTLQISNAIEGVDGKGGIRDELNKSLDKDYSEAPAPRMLWDASRILYGEFYSGTKPMRGVKTKLIPPDILGNKDDRDRRKACGIEFTFKDKLNSSQMLDLENKFNEYWLILEGYGFDKFDNNKWVKISDVTSNNGKTIKVMLKLNEGEYSTYVNSKSTKNFLAKMKDKERIINDWIEANQEWNTYSDQERITKLTQYENRWREQNRNSIMADTHILPVRSLTPIAQTRFKDYSHVVYMKFERFPSRYDRGQIEQAAKNIYGDVKIDVITNAQKISELGRKTDGNWLFVRLAFKKREGEDLSHIKEREVIKRPYEPIQLPELITLPDKELAEYEKRMGIASEPGETTKAKDGIDEMLKRLKEKEEKDKNESFNAERGIGDKAIISNDIKRLFAGARQKIEISESNAVAFGIELRDEIGAEEKNKVVNLFGGYGKVKIKDDDKTIIIIFPKQYYDEQALVKQLEKEPDVLAYVENAIEIKKQNELRADAAQYFANLGGGKLYGSIKFSLAQENKPDTRPANLDAIAQSMANRMKLLAKADVVLVNSRDIPDFRLEGATNHILSIMTLQDKDNPTDEERKQALDRARTTLEGFFDGNKVHIVIDNINSADRMAHVMIHETLGHYGLSALGNARKKEILSLMKQDTERIQAYLKSIKSDLKVSDLDADMLDRYAEEALVNEAPNGTLSPTLFERIVSAIKSFARQFFKLKLSDNDINIILRDMRDAAKVGADDKTTETRFSLKQASRVGAEGTAKAWAVNKSKGTDWNKIKSLDDMGAIARANVKRMTSPEYIKDITTSDIKGFLTDAANRQGMLNDPRFADEIRRYEAGETSRITEIQNMLNNSRTEKIGEWFNYLLKENQTYANDPFFLDLTLSNFFSPESMDKYSDKVGLPFQQAAIAKMYGLYSGTNPREPKSNNNPINFIKRYVEELRQIAMSDENTTLDTDTDGKWKIFKQTQQGDPDFDKIVGEIQALSCSTWCTRDAMAGEYIQQGDFLMYVTNDGKTKIGIRFEGDTIAEIQGPKNNKTLPHQYIHKIEELIASGKFEVSNDVKAQLRREVTKTKKIQRYTELYGKPDEELMGYGIIAWNDNGWWKIVDGELEVNNFGVYIWSNNNERIPTHKLSKNNIEEASIIHINANMPNLKYVNERADINTGAQANNLLYVGGKAYIHAGAQANKLLYVGEDAYIHEGAQANNLLYVGGKANIYAGAQANNLQYVGGYANIHAGAQANKLLYVGEDAYIRADAQANNLQYVGKNADIYAGAQANNLLYVGGKAYIRADAQANNLQYVGKDAYIRANVQANKYNRDNQHTHKAKLEADMNALKAKQQVDMNAIKDRLSRDIFGENIKPSNENVVMYSLAQKPDITILPPDHQINGITLEAALKMVENADMDVINHIKEGYARKRFSQDQIKHHVKNHALSSLGAFFDKGVTMAQYKEYNAAVGKILNALDDYFIGQNSINTMYSLRQYYDTLMAPFNDRLKANNQKPEDMKLFEKYISTPVHKAKRWLEWGDTLNVQTDRLETRSDLNYKHSNMLKPLVELAQKDRGMTEKVCNALIEGDRDDKYVAELEKMRKEYATTGDEALYNKIVDATRYYSDDILRTRFNLDANGIAAYRATRDMFEDIHADMVKRAEESVLIKMKGKSWYPLLQELGEEALPLARKIANKQRLALRKLNKQLNDVTEDQFRNVANSSTLVNQLKAELQNTLKEYYGNAKTDAEVMDIAEDMVKSFADIKKRTNELKTARAAFGKQILYFPREFGDGENLLIIKKATGETDANGVPIKKVIYFARLDDNKASTYKQAIRDAAEKLKWGNAERHQMFARFDPNKPIQEHNGYTIEMDYKGTEGANSDTRFFQVNNTNLLNLFNESVDALRNIEGVGKEKAEEIRKNLINAAADIFKARGWGQHIIRRKDNLVLGYEEKDILPIIRQYYTGYNGMVTKRDAMMKFTDIMKNMSSADLAAEKGYQGPKAGNLREDIATYIKDMTTNADALDAAVNRIKGVTSAWYLGFNPKSALVQITQNFVTGLPFMAQYMRQWRKDGIDVKGIAGTNWIRAAKDTLSYIKDKNSASLTDDEKRFLYLMHTKGITADQAIRDVRNVLEGEDAGRFDKAMDMAFKLFSGMETFNRQSMALAVFRMLNGKMEHDKIVNETRRMINDTHYMVQGQSNSPRFLTGQSTIQKIARIAYTFQSFQHQYWLSMLYNLKKDGKINADGMRTMAHSLGYLMLIGGATSLPLLGFIMDKLTEDKGNDVLSRLRKWLRSAGGKYMEDFGTYGAAGLLGINLSGSMSMNLPFANESPFGVAQGMVQKGKQAVGYAGQGDWYRTAESLAPEVLANPMRAIRMGVQTPLTAGVVTTPKGKIAYDEHGKPLTYDSYDMAMKILGFSPLDYTEALRVRHASDAIQKHYTDKRNSIYEQYRVDKNQHDPDAAKNMLKKIREYNDELRGDEMLRILVKPIKPADAMKNASQKPDYTEKKRVKYERNIEGSSD